jgi:2-dehydro-3-deoxygluconokinase
MTRDLVTFGEAMVRLVPCDFARLEQAVSLGVSVGGSELNAAVAAQRLGLSTAFVTRLPENALGRMVANKAREQGVDVTGVAWTRDDRVGLYFVEFGAAPRPNSVLYDRRGSAIARIKPGEVDWSRVLEGTRWFHTSGITPALSASAAEVTAEAVREAKRVGAGVSIDLNYRALLWSPDEARRAMTDLMQDTDVLITTEEDTERVFGIRGKDYEDVARKLVDRFGFAAVAITLRETPSVWRNTWTAIVLTEGKVICGPVCDLELVDRVGAGDAFAGGFLYGYLTDGPEKAIQYGVAVSALKQTNPGDFSWVTHDEVARLLSGGGLRIVR